MDTPSFQEDHISQIPALQMLLKLGYKYLSPAEINLLRGEKTSNVLLEDLVKKAIRRINSQKKISSTRFVEVNEANTENAIKALKELPLNDGYISASEALYNILTLGRSFDQLVEGNNKSITVQYIDWDNIENNDFYVAEEYSVIRSNGKEHYRPDIILFINGIPLGIIECKRPDMKRPIKQAISQHLRNQQDDGIISLYIYAQLLIGIASQEGAYGTNGTPEKFWAHWEEKFETEAEENHYQNTLKEVKNSPLSFPQKQQLFSGRFHYVRHYFEALEKEEILPTVQDEYLYALCRPERLMEIIFNFILFDNGTKKVARYQQFFAIKKSIKRMVHLEGGKRKGGVIWHTQGSGKSLTMVMLAQAIAMEPTINNPKIILVTDRTDLDDQITSTFRKCGVFVQNATTGKRLVELLESNNDAVVTTIINKFSAAVRKLKNPLNSPNIFVLVDEGHRTQHGTFNVEMEKTLPNACFIAMTGTPLFKKDKNTALKFGGIIDTYTVDQAVKDKAVVPLLYEGRLPRQTVNASPLDTFFSMVSEPFNEYQKADFKKKFSRADQLNSAEQKIYATAWDISLHFKKNWQGTGFKAQLVCDKKLNAIRFKEFLDEINIVSSEVLISSIDDREGEESVFDTTPEKVKRFWKKMMKEHGNSKRYEKNIINRFKNDLDPEIIIVVDKLLTGFDEPKNTILYLTRNLQSHKLLQAIARVNRVCPDKDFGYIIDYYGVIENLDDALDLYSSFKDFDEDDLQGTLINIEEEIKKLPQKHSELWDLFKEVSNKRDAEAYQVILKDEAKRAIFYDRLASFAKALKLALSTIEFHKEVEEKLIEKYKSDLSMFIRLRKAVIERYSDMVDYKKYEGQLQKLIDTHVTTDKVEVITELVNIFDKEKFQKEVENTTGKVAKADKIASRTAKHINEKMDEDPAFYKKFSQMLKDAISDYENKRISEVQYLTKVEEIMDKVLNRTDSDIPEVIIDKPVARAIYGITLESLGEKLSGENTKNEVSTLAAVKIEEIIKEAVLENGTPIIDWWRKDAIKGKLVIDIGDYLIDEVRDKYDLTLSFGDMDALASKYIDVARKQYK
ncbi:restriction endonuclease subunit R [Echinicola strongylocentroti]|uniref:Type I restriction enzyme endonuclease subunit n=1 Tax=Echinicola strongylocentroti TaxID=1795355 RepID=A0A2Z4IIQ5_9BACT|nr:HsdR family type I site-specific deoxyribonuclease [Echinicola strongylocentroti]AWW31011.1 restriction endonuclease subunit R [Echinicola strongylocentroti]